MSQKKKIKMCQIHFIKRKGKNIAKRDVKEFFNLMNLGSVNNNCAFGFFNDKTLFKSKGRFNLKGFKNLDKLSQSNFVVGHNRLATIGDKNKNYNNHPFRIDDFILVHNGIVSNHHELRYQYDICSKIETDSYVILWLINYYFKKSNIEDRNRKIVSAIKKAMDKIQGQISVCFYDILKNDLYYFKNQFTSFGFCLFDNSVLIGSTNPSNLEHIYLNEYFVFDEDCFKERIFKEPQDNKIYLINDEVFIKEVGEFECLGDSWDSFFPVSRWETGTVIDDEETTIEEEIAEAFHLALGYCPDFKFIESSGLIKIPFNKAVLKDLLYFVKTHFEENGAIFVDVDEVLDIIRKF